MTLARLAALLACAPLLAPAAALAQGPKPPSGLPAVSFEAAPVVRQAQAVDALKAWLVASQRDGKPFPRAADEGQAGKIVNAAFDRAAVTETENGQVLGRMCQDAISILTVYLRQGVPPEAGTAAMPMTKAIEETLNKNVLAYQAEEALAMDFTLDCSARLGFLYGRAYAQAPPTVKADQKAIAEVRNLQGSLFTFYRGGVGTVGAVDLEPRFKTTIMTSLSRNAAAVAAALTKPQRQALVEFIDLQAKQPGAAAFATDLTKLRGVFASAECNGLCAT